MSWTWPQACWLLILLPVLWPLWHWREKHRPSLMHPDFRLLVVHKTPRVFLARWLPFASRFLSALLLILALAGPRWPIPGSRIPSEGIALMLVLDVSGSMAERDVLLKGQPVLRLQAAQAALTSFLDGTDNFSNRGNDAIGLITFAVRPIDVCPPTLDHTSIKYFLDRIQPIGTVPDSSTNIGDALGLAVDLLSRSTLKSRCVLLISDGEHTVPAEIDAQALKPRQAAQLAAALGIRVHTIFFSGARSADASVRSAQERAEVALQDVARMTGGQSAIATDGNSLTQLSVSIDQLEKSRMESFVVTDYVELRPWLILTFVVLLLLTVVLESTWLRIDP
ncbi:MAG: VWA domain-containing protein [Planctomycetia bacterium]|nr:VWA domain-containing protein [Planctomycetia bacterium]